jgi:diketogulonate reductase-like aldo/keto reductase
MTNRTINKTKAQPIESGFETLHTVDDYSNAELIGFIVRRLRNTTPSRESAFAITKLHEVILWLDSDATRKLP